MLRFLSVAALFFCSCIPLSLADDSSHALTEEELKPHERLLLRDKPITCQFIVSSIIWDNPIQALNHISDLYHNQCYPETIALANEAKDRFSHKTFSLTKEAFEIFAPEGSFTEYVLESYERGYLTFLIAASYSQLNESKETPVELNKFYNEETALTYNFGQDPVNAVLQGAMWDNMNLDGYSSRPFWQWLVNAKNIDPSVSYFANTRLKQIDQKKSVGRWQIWEIGSFPELEWSARSSSSKNGYIDVKSRRKFIASCATDEMLVIPTSSWLQKIAIRHSQSYHPLVNIKSWLRLPFGLVYGATTFSAGAALAVGGCALDIGGKGDGKVCAYSLAFGLYAMSKSQDAIDYTLKPDLRHWEHLPEALAIAPENGTISKDCEEQTMEAADRRVL